MAVADGYSVESGELLVSVDSSSVGQCASSTSIDCNMSFSTGWILDSACSYHMCPHREWFATYEPLNGGSVSMGNDTKCRVVGIGQSDSRCLMVLFVHSHMFAMWLG